MSSVSEKGLPCCLTTKKPVKISWFDSKLSGIALNYPLTNYGCLNINEYYGNIFYVNFGTRDTDIAATKL